MWRGGAPREGMLRRVSEGAGGRVKTSRGGPGTRGVFSSLRARAGGAGGGGGPPSRAAVLVLVLEQDVERPLDADRPHVGRQHRGVEATCLGVETPHRPPHPFLLVGRVHALSSTQVTSPSMNRLSRVSGSPA